MLTKDSPASWINIAIGSLRPIGILQKSNNLPYLIDPANRLGAAVTAMAIGQLCAQACEFALKGLLFQISIDPGREHSCTKLFAKLPADKQNHMVIEFERLYIPVPGGEKLSLADFLENCANKNVAWRYLEGARFDVPATGIFVNCCSQVYSQPVGLPVGVQ
jgi:HEPN domain